MKRNDYGFIRDETMWSRAKPYVVGVMVVSVLLLVALFAFADPICPAWVAVAQGEIGRGEIGSDNHGPDVKKYLQGEEGKSWCAGFVSYCLARSGYKGRYILRARDYMKVGRIDKSPRPGDLIVFWRVNRDGRLGHVGIVEKVLGNRIVTIEGNTGEFPAKVKRHEYTIGQIPRLLGFVELN
jgi:uncharacterized protein (TIGR02594 family)